jgi:type II secretory pathway pseudopilin PulG
MRRNRVSGFTLIEIMIAFFLLSLAMFGILQLQRLSNLRSADAYLELLAAQLAKEPVEVYRGLGYEWIARHLDDTLADYPFYQDQDIAQSSFADDYPNEARGFSRFINVTREEVSVPGGKKMNAFRLSVTVEPKRPSWVGTWFTRPKGEKVTVETLVVEQPW